MNLNKRWFATRLLPIFLGIILISGIAIATVPSLREGFLNWMGQFGPSADVGDGIDFSGLISVGEPNEGGTSYCNNEGQQARGLDCLTVSPVSQTLGTPGNNIILPPPNLNDENKNKELAKRSNITRDNSFLSFNATQGPYCSVTNLIEYINDANKVESNDNDDLTSIQAKSPDFTLDQSSVLDISKFFPAKSSEVALNNQITFKVNSATPTKKYKNNEFVSVNLSVPTSCYYHCRHFENAGYNWAIGGYCPNQITASIPGKVDEDGDGQMEPGEFRSYKTFNINYQPAPELPCVPDSHTAAAAIQSSFSFQFEAHAEYYCNRNRPIIISLAGFTEKPGANPAATVFIDWPEDIVELGACVDEEKQKEIKGCASLPADDPNYCLVPLNEAQEPEEDLSCDKSLTSVDYHADVKPRSELLFQSIISKDNTLIANFENSEIKRGEKGSYETISENSYSITKEEVQTPKDNYTINDKNYFVPDPSFSHKAIPLFLNGRKIYDNSVISNEFEDPSISNIISKSLGVNYQKSEAYAGKTVNISFNKDKGELGYISKQQDPKDSNKTIFTFTQEQNNIENDTKKYSITLDANGIASKDGNILVLIPKNIQAEEPLSLTSELNTGDSIEKNIENKLDLKIFKETLGEPGIEIEPKNICNCIDFGLLYTACNYLDKNEKENYITKFINTYIDKVYAENIDTGVGYDYCKPCNVVDKYSPEEKNVSFSDVNVIAIKEVEFNAPNEIYDDYNFRAVFYLPPGSIYVDGESEPAERVEYEKTEQFEDYTKITVKLINIKSEEKIKLKLHYAPGIKVSDAEKINDQYINKYIEITENIKNDIVAYFDQMSKFSDEFYDLQIKYYEGMLKTESKGGYYEDELNKMINRLKDEKTEIAGYIAKDKQKFISDSDNFRKEFERQFNDFKSQWDQRKNENKSEYIKYSEVYEIYSNLKKSIDENNYKYVQKINKTTQEFSEVLNKVNSQLSEIYTALKNDNSPDNFKTFLNLQKNIFEQFLNKYVNEVKSNLFGSGKIIDKTNKYFSKNKFINNIIEVYTKYNYHKKLDTKAVIENVMEEKEWDKLIYKEVDIRENESVLPESEIDERLNSTQGKLLTPIVGVFYDQNHSTSGILKVYAQEEKYDPINIVLNHNLFEYNFEQPYINIDKIIREEDSKEIEYKYLASEKPINYEIDGIKYTSQLFPGDKLSIEYFTKNNSNVIYNIENDFKGGLQFYNEVIYNGNKTKEIIFDDKVILGNTYSKKIDIQIPEDVSIDQKQLSIASFIEYDKDSCKKVTGNEFKIDLWSNIKAKFTGLDGKPITNALVVLLQDKTPIYDFNNIDKSKIITNDNGEFEYKINRNNSTENKYQFELHYYDPVSYPHRVIKTGELKSGETDEGKKDILYFRTKEKELANTKEQLYDISLDYSSVDDLEYPTDDVYFQQVVTASDIWNNINQAFKTIKTDYGIELSKYNPKSLEINLLPEIENINKEISYTENNKIFLSASVWKKPADGKTRYHHTELHEFMHYIFFQTGVDGVDDETKKIDSLPLDVPMMDESTPKTCGRASFGMINNYLCQFDLCERSYKDTNEVDYHKPWDLRLADETKLPWIYSETNGSDNSEIFSRARTSIENGYPVMLMFNPPGYYHIVVLTGWDDKNKTFIANNPARGINRPDILLRKNVTKILGTPDLSEATITKYFDHPESPGLIYVDPNYARANSLTESVSNINAKYYGYLNNSTQKSLIEGLSAYLAVDLDKRINNYPDWIYRYSKGEAAYNLNVPNPSFVNFGSLYEDKVLSGVNYGNESWVTASLIKELINGRSYINSSGLFAWINKTPIFNYEFLVNKDSTIDIKNFISDIVLKIPQTENKDVFSMYTLLKNANYSNTNTETLKYESSNTDNEELKKKIRVLVEQSIGNSAVQYCGIDPKNACASYVASIFNPLLNTNLTEYVPNNFGRSVLTTGGFIPDDQIGGRIVDELDFSTMGKRRNSNFGSMINSSSSETLWFNWNYNIDFYKSNLKFGDYVFYGMWLSIEEKDGIIVDDGLMHSGIYLGEYSGPDGKGNYINCDGDNSLCVAQLNSSIKKIVVVDLEKYLKEVKYFLYGVRRFIDDDKITKEAQIDDLDKKFLLYGFFADKNGNWHYDIGEPIGKSANWSRFKAKYWDLSLKETEYQVNNPGFVSSIFIDLITGSSNTISNNYKTNIKILDYGEEIDKTSPKDLFAVRKDRTENPSIIGSNILINFENKDVNSINVDIKFDQDYSQLNYNYSLDVENGQAIYLSVPYPTYHTITTVTTNDSSDYLVIDSDDYWNSMGSDFIYDYYLSKTFNMDGGTPQIPDNIDPEKPKELTDEDPIVDIMNPVDDTADIVAGQDVTSTLQNIDDNDKVKVAIDDDQIGELDLLGNDAQINVPTDDGLSLGKHTVKILDENDNEIASSDFYVKENKWFNKYTYILFAILLIIGVVIYFIYKKKNNNSSFDESDRYEQISSPNLD